MNDDEYLSDASDVSTNARFGEGERPQYTGREMSAAVLERRRMNLTARQLMERRVRWNNVDAFPPAEEDHQSNDEDDDESIIEETVCSANNYSYYKLFITNYLISFHLHRQTRR